MPSKDVEIDNSKTEREFSSMQAITTDDMYIAIYSVQLSFLKVLLNWKSKSNDLLENEAREDLNFIHLMTLKNRFQRNCIFFKLKEKN